ncbi:MAG: serine/threonine protein kinase [Gammaproteobacteria bacterium]|jgi:serine/threonine protein kinase
MEKKKKKTIIDQFDLSPGRMIARKYEIVEKLGTGWEGEVYKIVEKSTGIERAAKFFYPQRNIDNKVSRRYAKQLHKLRHCPIIIQYYAEEIFIYRRIPITVLISEYIEGELLSDFLKRQQGRRITAFQGLHLLYALVQGLEQIHLYNEYHGDLHEENIMVSRYGLGFELKLLDSFQWPDSKRSNLQEDLLNVIRILYDVIGGQKHYATQPKVIKNICCGLKKSLILTKFKNVTRLRKHLESLSWDE